MKTCQSCGISKSLSEFHERSKAKDGLQNRCKECNREQRKAYYKTAHGKDKNTLSGKRWVAQIRFKIYEYLTKHPCVDCGESDPIVLEFDHRDPLLKEFSICNEAGRIAWSRIEAEIAKCDVRCANCHRRRTASQFDWNKIAWING